MIWLSIGDNDRLDRLISDKFDSDKLDRLINDKLDSDRLDRLM
jgi:hypothetical protein